MTTEFDYMLGVCVRACVCVRECMRVCERACVCVHVDVRSLWRVLFSLAGSRFVVLVIM